MSDPSNSSPDAFLRPLVNALMHPPFFVRLLHGFTFPVVVATRHNFGERYYRSALLGRLITYLVCLAPLPMIPYGWAFVPALGLCLAAGVWYVRSDFQCRREIRQRKARGEQIHSYYPGAPRFGMEDNNEAKIKIALRVLLLGFAVTPFAVLLGTYLFVAGLGLLAEGWWLKTIAHEARLNEQDSRLTGSGGSPLAATGSIAGLAQSPLTSQPRPKPSSDPLAGFGDVLATSTSTLSKK